MSSVSNIAGITRVVSYTVSWVAHFFSNSFQKLIGNEYCLKLKNGFS